MNNRIRSQCIAVALTLASALAAAVLIGTWENSPESSEGALPSSFMQSGGAVADTEPPAPVASDRLANHVAGCKARAPIF